MINKTIFTKSHLQLFIYINCTNLLVSGHGGHSTALGDQHARNKCWLLQLVRAREAALTIWVKYGSFIKV
jgi:hypothetical protein